MAINYTVSNDWGSGFTGSMTVPGGSQGLQGHVLGHQEDSAPADRRTTTMRRASEYAVCMGRPAFCSAW